jgi:predicted dehydrogenase
MSQSDRKQQFNGPRRLPPRVRVGVIGVGRMGTNHVRVYRTLSDACVLVGVYDVDTLRAAEVAQSYGVRGFESIDELLESVDAVSIASPSHLHVEHTVMALAAGVHALVEKPVALSAADAEPLRLAVQAAPSCVLQVGHIEHFNPAIAVLSGILADMSLVALDIRRLSPAGGRSPDTDVIQDLMLHDIHVALTLDHGPLVGVQAVAAPWRTPHEAEYASAHLMFDDGVIACLSASRVTEAKVRHLSATTTEAHVTMDYLRRTIEVSRWTRFDAADGGRRSYRQESMIERFYVPEEEPLVAQLRSFLDHASQGDHPEVDLAMGIRCIEVVDRIRVAAAGAVQSETRLEHAT